MRPFLPPTRTSTSAGYLEARAKVISGYRKWMRESMWIVDNYSLDVPASAIRACIRHQYEKNRHISDLRMIDVLIFKAQSEFDETINLWKQKNHIMNFLDANPPQGEAKPTFLESFYNGRD